MVDVMYPSVHHHHHYQHQQQQQHLPHHSHQQQHHPHHHQGQQQFNKYKAKFIESKEEFRRKAVVRWKELLRIFVLLSCSNEK